MPKMFIYGSCLSRDAKNFFTEDWKASTYVARQSMISAANGPAGIVGTSKLKSAFQNRMVDYDIAGNAVQLLEEKLGDHDLLLIDLVDERRGVYELAPGRYVTRSYEVVSSQLMKQQENPPRWIDFGTDEHFELWTKAADTILAIVWKHNVLALAVTPPWASITNGGNELQYKKGPVAAINQDYMRYNEYLRDAGISLVTIGEDEAIADENHKWGPATFHYDESVYVKLHQQIMGYFEAHTK